MMFCYHLHKEADYLFFQFRFPEWNNTISWKPKLDKMVPISPTSTLKVSSPQAVFNNAAIVDKLI